MFSPTTGTPASKRPLRAALRRVVDTVVSFALLEDIDASSSSDHHVDPHELHPHRRPLPPRDRDRRPGARISREQDCLTPLTARTRQRTSSSAHALR